MQRSWLILKYNLFSFIIKYILVDYQYNLLIECYLLIFNLMSRKLIKRHCKTEVDPKIFNGL